MKRKIKTFLIITLLLVEVCTIHLAVKSYNSKNNELPQVQLKEPVKNKQVALMLEQTKGQGDYQDGSATYQDSFPTEGYKLNESMSGCTDIDGKKIEGALSYDKDTYAVSINTNKTAYCYLYYDIYEKTINILRKYDAGNYLSALPVGGMYRYQGLYTDDIKNYICLGDSCCTTESCGADSNDDMYRIIGITQSGEMKVIKKTALTDALGWWSDASVAIKWPQSLIYQKLNGKSNDGSTNKNLEDINSYYYGLDGNLKSKIVKDYSWLYGDENGIGSFGYNGDTIYGIESGWSDTIDAPIGLMYISDYYYAYKTNEDDAGKPGNYQNALNSWIHISHNETTHPSGSDGYEWTMSRYGLNSATSTYHAWTVSAIGRPNFNGLSNEHALRPSFYLSSDVELSGEGSLTVPFRITNLEG